VGAGPGLASGDSRISRERERNAKAVNEFSGRSPEKHALELDEIDQQHEQLVSIMNLLTKRDADRAPKAELAELLEQLVEATLRHFEAEEAYMAGTGYPKLDTHQIIHRDLLATLQRHVGTFYTGHGRLGVQLLSFLKFWLSAHMKGIDELYAQQRLRPYA
jgi:hemerythrin